MSRDGTNTAPDRRLRRRALVMLAAFALLLVSAAPYRQYYAAKQRVKSLKQREVALDHRIADLETARDKLGTDAEVERLARELGYVRPGEVPFVLVAP